MKHIRYAEAHTRRDQHKRSVISTRPVPIEAYESTRLTWIQVAALGIAVVLIFVGTLFLIWPR